MVLATSVSVARVMKDRHWSTDILAGATIGTLSGWAVPRFLHFRGRPRGEGSRAGGAPLVPTATADSVSLALAGAF
jgi:membrane-associated phospholipid phosphatase